MAKPRALVLQAVGTNRDLDVMQALELAGAEPCRVPLNYLRSGRVNWGEFQMLVLPGGFSYADALGAGKLLALDLDSYFADEIRAFVEAKKPVIGICNGFQALVKSGILLDPNLVRATLTFNAVGHFECRWVVLKPISQKCIWTRALVDRIICPVAHGEGNFCTGSQADLDRLTANDQVALIYTDGDGRAARGQYPLNPNGSLADIAGVCNPQGNVLGLMPHPENHIFPNQHPRVHRGVSGESGLPIFVQGVEYASQL